MTNKISRGLVQMAGIFIIAVAAFASAHAQTTVRTVGAPMPRPTPAPFTQNLTGLVRIPKSFGVVPSSAGSTRPASDPCYEFYVAALDPDNGNRVITHNRAEKGRDDGEFFSCKYTITAPGNKRLYVIAGMGSTTRLPQQTRDPHYITDAWIGGTNNKPRRGYERGFAGKFVTLGNKASYLRFDLYYAQVDPN